MPEFTHLDEPTPPDAWAPWREAAPMTKPWASARRLVVLSAHPDDECLGAGGLIAACAAHGVEVIVISATWGDASHPDSPTHTPQDLVARRREEMATALRALAPDATHVALALPDGHLAGQREALVDAVLAQVDDGAGTVLVSTWHGDGHPDHEACGEAVREAGRRCGARVLLAPVWLFQWGDPATPPAEEAVVVPLEPAWRQAKADAIDAHVSQHRPLSDEPGDEPILSRDFLRHFSDPREIFLIPTGQGSGHPDQAAAAAPDVTEAMERVHDDADPWGVDRHFYERRKRAVTLAALPRERFASALEVGCSVGALTADLATRCDRLVGVDVSDRALARARERIADLDHVSFEVRHLPDQWPDGDFDLIVVSETGYYLTAQELDELVARCDACLTADGVIVLCHWNYPIEQWPLDGIDVHARFAAQRGWTVSVHHVEPDFTLDVLQRHGQPTPAQREGLV